MMQRPLGNSGLSIAPLVFGGNVFGWTADTAMSFRLLDRFVERGFNAIDTADVYSAWAPGNQGGESETVMGQWLAQRGRRDDVIIATKVGKWTVHPGLRAQNIVDALEDSLRRLQTDYVDLYYAHADDADVPLEETLEAFERLKQAGKVRALGASNYSAQRLELALNEAKRLGVTPYTVLQPLYNLYDREDYEAELQAVAEKHNIGVVPYFALASGFLSGKYQNSTQAAESDRARFLGKYFNERGDRVLQALNQVAAQLRVSASHVAVAWLLTRPGITAPIVSARNMDQLDTLLDAVSLVIPDDALAVLNQASDWR